MAAEFRALSIMAAPLVVGNEVIGATTFLHSSDPDFFNEDLAAKATILAGQLGSLLEARRLTQVSREEHRRTEILAEVAQALRSAPESAAVVEAVADRLRVLLRTRLVCMLLREGAGFSLRAVAAESPQLAASVRSRHDRRGLQFAADLASRAVAAGEPISVAIDPATHALGDLVPPGMLIAAPFRTSVAQGAVLVYPRPEGVFTTEEKSLVSVVTGFGAVAIANAELCNTARAQAHELHQLLDISAELGSIGQLDEFLQRFALRAADFLGFGRGFIGLLENGIFRVRWGAENGKPEAGGFRASRRTGQPRLAQPGSVLVRRSQQTSRSSSGASRQLQRAAIVDRSAAGHSRRSPGHVRRAGSAGWGRHLAGRHSSRPGAGGTSCRRAGSDSKPSPIRVAPPAEPSL